MQLDATGPFTRRQALAAGITAKQLRGSAYRQVMTGVYVSSAVKVTPTVRTKAALLTQPEGAVASHWSVARLVGAPVPSHPDEHVTVPTAGRRRRRLGVRCHVAALQEREIHRWEGVKVTDPLRFFLDMTNCLTLVDAVVLGDWLVRRRGVSVADLVAHCRKQPRAMDAQRAAALVRRGVDSPMETRVRLLLVLAGLPEPRVDHRIRDADGHVLRRLDLCYEQVRLAVEYDGRQHVELLEQWESDPVRRDELEDDSWRLLTETSRGIFVDPEQTVQRVHRALRKAGWPGLRRPTDGWRTHFPSRAAAA